MSQNHLELCLASEHFYPAYSGAATQFLQYLPGLKERGVHTRVLTQTPTPAAAKASGLEVSWRSYRPGEMLPVEKVMGVPVYRVRLPEFSSIRRGMHYGQTLFRFCRQPSYRPDLIQFVGLPLWALPWLLRLRSLDIPMTGEYMLPAEFSPGRLKRAFQRHYWRLPFQLLDGVIVNSAVMKERLSNYLGVTTRIEVIPNEVNLQRFRPAENATERQSMRRVLGIGEDELIVATVGAVHPRKGTDLLVDAWVQLASNYPHSHLVIIGPRFDISDPSLAKFRRELETRIAASGVADRVHFVGNVRNVEDYLRAADVFVFASLREGVPAAILEAMASGLPVITTRFLGFPEELGHEGQQFLLIDRDSALVSNMIEKVLGDKPLRMRIGDSARRWIEAELDFDNTVNHLADMYRTLVNRTGEAGL